MGETRISAKFRYHGDEYHEVVINPFCNDKIFIIETEHGLLYCVEASDVCEAIETLVEDERFGHCLRVPEEDYAQCGMRIERGEEVNGETYEKGGWFLCDGTISADPEAYVRSVQVTGQGLYYDDEGVWAHRLNGSKVRYFGTYEGVKLPDTGVLFTNFREWHDRATQTPDERTRRERREEMRYDYFLTLRARIRELFRRAEQEGWSSDRLGGRLAVDIDRSHEYGQCGRDYQREIDGYIVGYREQWEERVLEARWAPVKREEPFSWLNEDETRVYRRDELRYLGLYYRDLFPGPGKEVDPAGFHYEGGDPADWLLRKGDSFYQAGEPDRFGSLGGARRFYTAEQRLDRKMAEAIGGQWVHLQEIRRQAMEKAVNLDHRSKAVHIFQRFTDEEREIWGSVERLAELRGDLNYSYVMSLTLEELGN